MSLISLVSKESGLMMSVVAVNVQNTLYSIVEGGIYTLLTPSSPTPRRWELGILHMLSPSHNSPHGDAGYRDAAVDVYVVELGSVHQGYWLNFHSARSHLPQSSVTLATRSSIHPLVHFRVDAVPSRRVFPRWHSPAVCFHCRQPSVCWQAAWQAEGLLGAESVSMMGRLVSTTAVLIRKRTFGEGFGEGFELGI